MVDEESSVDPVSSSHWCVLDSSLPEPSVPGLSVPERTSVEESVPDDAVLDESALFEAGEVEVDVAHACPTPTTPATRALAAMLAEMIPVAASMP